MKEEFFSVTPLDIQKSYNGVSNTYSLWLQRMGKFTDAIIVSPKSGDAILDLCAGTGYISKALLKENQELTIDAVDISAGMLAHINEPQVRCFEEDALYFLKRSVTQYKQIYIGYGLPYIEKRSLYKAINDHLVVGGTCAFITNIKGTLQHSYKMLFSIWLRHPFTKIKPFKVRLKTVCHYKKRLKQYGFELIKDNCVEEYVSFTSQEEFIQWLFNSGAFAGVEHIFPSLNIGEEMKKYVDRYYLIDGVYTINHRFYYVVAKRGDNK